MVQQGVALNISAHFCAGAAALSHAMELHEVIMQQRTQDTVCT